MRRADRLFQIIQVLRRTRKPLTADAIAAELETSKRTIYRDIAELIGQRVPIRGEAGMGYVLEKGFDMPPLMLTPDEIEAAVLGAQWVSTRGDAALARGARDLIAKIGAVIPDHLRPYLMDSTVSASGGRRPVEDGFDIARLRAWVHAGKKVALTYRDQEERRTERVICHIVVGYYVRVGVIIAWCEIRGDFRNLRTDRFNNADST